MKDSFINGCKRLKVLWDTYKIVKAIIVFLGLIGVGSVGYFATDTSEQKPELVSEPEITITLQPEYALKDHAHAKPIQIIIDHTPAIKQAISEYDEQHQTLKH